MRFILPALLILALTLPAVADETVTIALPSLAGPYPPEAPERTAAFAVDFDPGRILDVTLQVAGTATEGVVYCGSREPVPWLLDLGGFLVDDTSGGWWAAFDPSGVGKGDFDRAYGFRASLSTPPSWDFLADGEGSLVFHAGPMALIAICGPFEAYPDAKIASVELVFRLGSSASTQEVTWSTLKALYR